MRNLLKLLRTADENTLWTGEGGLFQRAADEIERLQARVEELEGFVMAEGEAHYSSCEFKKIEKERDQLREVVKSMASAATQMHNAIERLTTELRNAKEQHELCEDELREARAEIERLRARCLKLYYD